MAELMRETTYFNLESFVLEGKFTHLYTMTGGTGTGKVRMGQIVSYDVTTGKLIPYVEGTNEPFSIIIMEFADTEIDLESGDQKVAILQPNGGKFNHNKLYLDYNTPYVHGSNNPTLLGLWKIGIPLVNIDAGEEV